MNMMRVILVHALLHSVAPYREAFGRLWPECEALHMLDETLYADLGNATTVPPPLEERMARILHHAAGSGADALVFTGSTFGPAIEGIAAGLTVPLFRADEAAAQNVAEAGSRVAILATAARALPVVADRVARAFAASGSEVDLVTRHVEGAQAALFAGRQNEHDALIADAAIACSDRDVILLAQSSMAASRDLAPPGIRARILTTPEATVRTLRARFARNRRDA